MKTLKIIRLLSLIGALGIIAAYTITNAVKGEMETFNWVFLTICVVIAVFGIASDAQREKHPRALVQYNKKRRNILLAIYAIAILVGFYDMIAFEKGVRGIPFILIITYMLTNTLIRYKARREYLDENGEVNSGDVKGDDLVAVAKYTDPVKAHIAKGLLETNGIEAVIFGDGLQQTIGSGAHIFPIIVMVKNSDKDIAEKLINERSVE